MSLQRLKIILFGMAVLLVLKSVAEARHKCPKVPSPPGLLGITSIPTLLPSGTFMVAARSSNTSGCDWGHPSADFYRPIKAEVKRFIEENHEIVSEETARGTGPYLEALARITGCAEVSTRFARALRDHHRELFLVQELVQSSSARQPSAAFITDRIFELKEDSPFLSPWCHSS